MQKIMYYEFCKIVSSLLKILMELEIIKRQIYHDVYREYFYDASSAALS